MGHLGSRYIRMGGFDKDYTNAVKKTLELGSVFWPRGLRGKPGNCAGGLEDDLCTRWR